MPMHGNSLLTIDQEAEVVGVILGMANISKPLDIKTLLAILNNLYKPEELRFGRKWFSGFQSRWSRFITKSKSQLITHGRSSANNLQAVDGFIDFHRWYRETNLHPPHAIFNVDESRVSISEAKRAGLRLVSRKYRKSGTRGKRDKQHCSVVPFVSATGEVISVFYVLASKPGQTTIAVPHVASERDKTTWCEYFMTTPNGYTNDSVFPSMVAQFEQDFHVRYPDQPALVYADRLSSHTTAELLAATADHQVSFVLFPAGTSQFIQPLDDVVFALFKNKLRMHRDRLMAAEPLKRNIAQDTLLSAMVLALHETLKPGPIKASFRNTGIHPWNPEKIFAAARSAVPDPNHVDALLPTRAQQILSAIQQASPKAQGVVVTRFRKHRQEQGKAYRLEDLVRQQEEYEAEKQAEAAAKAERAGNRLAAAAERRAHRLEQLDQREAARAERARAQADAVAIRDLQRRQASCHYCSAAWRGSAAWLWCDHCEDCGICPGCRRDPTTYLEFQEHERGHLAH